MQTTIIIPVYNQHRLTRICLNALDRHTPAGFEAIVIDNGSTDGVGDWLSSLHLQNGRLRLIRNPENLGYGHACNQGLAAATGGVVVLLNNDAVVTRGWLERLRRPLEQDRRIGITGPRTNNALAPQLIETVPATLAPADMEALAARMAVQFAGQGADVTFISGFCMALRRDVVERLGGLDPRFGLAYFEDVDYCVRARLAGYRLRVCADTYVHHFGSQTAASVFGDPYAANRANWRLFAEKWGLPADREPWGEFTVAELEQGRDPHMSLYQAMVP